MSMIFACFPVVVSTITIQSTPRAYGHVTVSKAWHKSNGEQRHELNLDAGTLDRPIEDVTATLLHEMVHLYHLQTGVQDCSRGGTYHNKKFKATAEACDLRIEYDPRIGWSITFPTEVLIDFIITQGWEDIRMAAWTVISLAGRDAGRAQERPSRPSPRKRAALASISVHIAKCQYVRLARSTSCAAIAY